MPKKWNTMKFTLWGALAGFLYGAITSGPYWRGNTEMMLEGMGAIFGSGVGVAILVAIVCGVRNLFVR